jgi:hypothetical protein
MTNRMKWKGQKGCGRQEGGEEFVGFELGRKEI